MLLDDADLGGIPFIPYDCGAGLIFAHLLDLKRQSLKVPAGTLTSSDTLSIVRLTVKVLFATLVTMSQLSPWAMGNLSMAFYRGYQDWRCKFR